MECGGRVGADGERRQRTEPGARDRIQYLDTGGGDGARVSDEPIDRSRGQPDASPGATRCWTAWRQLRRRNSTSGWTNKTAATTRSDGGSRRSTAWRPRRRRSAVTIGAGTANGSPGSRDTRFHLFRPGSRKIPRVSTYARQITEKFSARDRPPLFESMNHKADAGTMAGDETARMRNAELPQQATARSTRSTFSIFSTLSIPHSRDGPMVRTRVQAA